jgi:Zn-dependent protease with chaperone function
MAMNSKQAEAVAQQIITSASKLFYNGKDPTVFGEKLVAKVVIEKGATPNASLTPVDGGYGVAVSQGLLDIKDDVAIKFVIAHELGHAFSETILTSIGMHGIGGEATEVIADLAAVHVLVEIGNSWTAVLASIAEWQTLDIFDAAKSGDHPAGAKRAQYIMRLSTAMTGPGKETFENAARQICNNL